MWRQGQINPGQCDNRNIFGSDGLSTCTRGKNDAQSLRNVGTESAPRGLIPVTAATMP